MSSQIPNSLASLEAIISEFVGIYDRVVNGQVGFLRLIDLKADESFTANLPDGTIVRIVERGGFDLIVVSSGNVHFSSAAGTQFRVDMERSSPLYFEAVGDGQTDDTIAIDRLLSSGAMEADLFGRDYVYSGTFQTQMRVFNGRIIDDDGAQDYRLLTEDRVATPDEASAGVPENKVASIKSIAEIVASQISTQSLRNIVQNAFLQPALYQAAPIVDLGDLSTSIITAHENSRVKIEGSISLDCNHDAVLKVTRNGVELFNNSEIAPGARLVGMLPIPYDTNTDSTMALLSFSFLDQVAEAGEYEYRFSIQNPGNLPIAINRTFSNSPTIGELASSFIILEEIRS